MTTHQTVQMTTLNDLLQQANGLPQPIDVPIVNQRFELDGAIIKFGGMPAGTLSLYQVGSLGRVNAAVGDVAGQLRQIESNGPMADAAVGWIRSWLTSLNAAVDDRVKNAKNPIIARTINVDGITTVGGIVTSEYVPLTHVELLEALAPRAFIGEAIVVRSTISPTVMSATMMLHGTTYAVDGGIKAGFMLGNGQFGNKAVSATAMLFRLLCTNGLMDVASRSMVWRRHLGCYDDLIGSVDKVVSRAEEMFGTAKLAMTADMNATEYLMKLYSVGLIGRGVLRRALETVASGTDVPRNVNTLWGIVQVISAVSRAYGFTQMSSLGRLAGRILVEGMESVLDGRPVVNGDAHDVADDFDL